MLAMVFQSVWSLFVDFSSPLDTALKRVRQKDTLPRVLVIGPTGVGKSSTIQLLFPDVPIEISSGDASGPRCTKAPRRYEGLSPSGIRAYSIWDTAGLSEDPESLSQLVRLVKAGAKVGWNLVMIVVRFEQLGEQIPPFVQSLAVLDRLLRNVSVVLLVTHVDHNNTLFQEGECFDSVIKGDLDRLAGESIRNLLRLNRISMILPIYSEPEKPTQGGVHFTNAWRAASKERVWEAIANLSGTRHVYEYERRHKVLGWVVKDPDPLFDHVDVWAKMEVAHYHIKFHSQAPN